MTHLEEPRAKRSHQRGANPGQNPHQAPAHWCLHPCTTFSNSLCTENILNLFFFSVKSTCHYLTGWHLGRSAASILQSMVISSSGSAQSPSKKKRVVYIPLSLYQTCFCNFCSKEKGKKNQSSHVVFFFPIYNRSPQLHWQVLLGMSCSELADTSA